MPYEWIVNFARNLLLSGPIAFGETHAKNASNDPRDSVLRLIQVGAVRQLFIEFADFDLTEYRMGNGMLGEYLRARAVQRSMDEAWARMKFMFRNVAYQGPGPDFVEAAVNAGVMIYLADLADTGFVDGGSDEGVRMRDTHWARVFDDATQGDAKGAVILVGADHLVRFPGVDVQPLHFQCRIPLTRVFDLRTGERFNPDAVVVNHRPFPPRAKDQKSFAEIWSLV